MCACQCVYIVLLYKVYECDFSASLDEYSECQTAAVSAYVLCTPCTSLQCHFIRSHIRRMHVCFAVTCNLHFWQNDLDLSRATAVTRGWNGYRNKRQHRKLTMEKNIISMLLPGIEPETSRSRIRRLPLSHPRSRV